ncbi:MULTISPECIES: AraC family transcriptional regulator [Enterococcus]|uniref:HTH araC/xylS-type domain-containing protein n=1 Tax=Enterococcus durans TaxID=53345 RepID=A0A367CGD5_9ENTE|nr:MULTISPECIES: AraC family transcriptional regulator [Enterococcus]MDB1678627.1 AraC family transcriptional regulator [Enterococcus durans]RCA11556.1 hypothetical protein EA71_02321 [Enterococcus durans]
MSNEVNDKLEYLLDLSNFLLEILGINIYFTDESYHIKHNNSNGNILNPRYKSNSALIKSLMNNRFGSFEKKPIIYQTAFSEYFIIYRVEGFGNIILGPVRTKKITHVEVRSLLYDNNIFSDHTQFFTYYDSIKVIATEQLLSVIKYLNYQIFEVKLSDNCILDDFIFSTNYETELLSYEKVLINVRSNLDFHHDIKNEHELLNAIKIGRKELIPKYLDKISSQNNGVLSKKSLLRSIKNQGISAITLGTRAALEGGLNQEIAFIISDKYIQRMEDMNDTVAVAINVQDALYKLADEVGKSKTVGYSKKIIDAQHYIYSHIFEEISIHSVADYLNLSCSYFSKILKKEVGETVHRYILRVKIDEAKNLIEHIDLPISEIGMLLNFSDQSHFTKIFKVFTGITPKIYKSLLR